MDAGQEFELSFMATGHPEHLRQVFFEGWMASASALTAIMVDAAKSRVTHLGDTPEGWLTLE
jgi:hypothetical protein